MWLRNISEWGWFRGAVGGFIGSVGFGLIMMFIMPAPILEVAIPWMYGIESSPQDPSYMAGWFFHLYHGVILGLTYVALVEHKSIKQTINPYSINGSIALGIIYGIVTTIIFAVILMPIWLGSVGFGGAPPFPNISVPGSIIGLFGHIVYALGLSLIYGIFKKIE